MSVTTIGVGDDYEVLVGHGLLSQVAAHLRPETMRVLVIHPEPLPQYGITVAEALRAAGLEVHVEAVPDAEPAKTIEVAAHLWGVLGRAAFTRTDAVIAVGGGSVTDLGGFVAAAWLRGVDVIQVPTTVLGMVDAAVGGKTGINTAEGKNLVGAFHPPRAVLCDLDTLATLPHADLVAGLAEVVKGGFIADPVILDLIEADPADAARTGPRLRELIERKIAVKARVVAADLKESSLREILNYGHTYGHAVEQAEGYRMRHGEAVAIGLVFAAELARQAGQLGDAQVARHRAVLSALGLPTTYAGASWEQLLTVMRRDKKTRGATLRFVTLTDIGEPTRLVGPQEDWLVAADAAVRG